MYAVADPPRFHLWGTGSNIKLVSRIFGSACEVVSTPGCVGIKGTVLWMRREAIPRTSLDNGRTLSFLVLEIEVVPELVLPLRRYVLVSSNTSFQHCLHPCII